MESARSTLAGQPVGLVALAVALGAFSAFDAYFLRVVPAQVPMYAALFILSAGVVLNMLLTRPVDSRLLALAIGVVVLFSISLVRVPFQNVFILRYVAGDMAVYSLVGIYLAGAAASLDGREWSRVAYLVILLSAFGSMLAATTQTGSGRFEAPATLVIASVGALILHYRGVRQALLVVLAGLVVLGAAVASGSRTSLGLLVGAVVIGVFCRFCSRRKGRPGIGGRPGIKAPVVGATALLGLIFVTPSLGFVSPFDEEGPKGKGKGLERSAAGSAGRGPRVIRVPPSTTDTSLLSRTTEASDVMGEIQDGGAVAIALGFGPGASYVPVRSTVSEHNLNEHGTIHSVHITPVMLLYRYGLIGVVSFLAIIVLAVRAVWFFASPDRQDYGFGEVTIMFSLPLFLVQMLLVNVTVNPVWAYAVAGSVLILREADAGSDLAEA